LEEIDRDWGAGPFLVGTTAIEMQRIPAEVKIPLIHTFIKLNLAQNIGSLKCRDVEKKHPPPNGPAKYPWGQEEIKKTHQIDSYHLYLCTLPMDRKTNGLCY
jgi:hypothetical protein